jgi:hypothetical protein
VKITEERQEAREQQRYPLRLPREDLEALRVAAFAMNISINEAIQTAVHEWLANTGRREQVKALMKEAMSQYEVALDKLADS